MQGHAKSGQNRKGKATQENTSQKFGQKHVEIATGLVLGFLHAA